jgi:hypothetical protein
LNPRVSGDDVVVDIPKCGICRIDEQYQGIVPIPSTFKGLSLTVVNSHQLKGIELNPPPLNLDISTEGDLKISANISKVCPKIDEVSVSGCYHCGVAGSLTVKAFSECETGSVSIETLPKNCLVLSLDYLELTKNPEELIVPFSSNIRTSTCTLTLRSGLFTSNKTFTFVLEEPPRINFEADINSTLAEKYVEHSGLGDAISKWWDDQKGPFDIVKWSLIALAIFLALVCLILVLKWTFAPM